MFAGFYRRDGGPVVADVDAMMRALPNVRRSEEGAWFGDGVAAGPVLGHDLARHLAVVGELRLTNAASLAEELHLPCVPDSRDADVILAAYVRWGEHLAERLEGDFAFALWDGRRQRMLCARDRFGVKPFYYHLSPRTMAFASDAAAVLSAPEVPRRLNAKAIASYLAASLDDRVATGFVDVVRLSPGQTFSIDRTTARCRTYWSPDSSTELRLRSDAQYEEAFRAALTAAVTSRMAEGPVGVSLSGGLDSGSIACIAGRHGRGALHTYTAVFASDPKSDERPWAAAAVARSGAVATACDPAGTSPLAAWAGASWMGASPACNPQLSVCRVTLQAAARDRVPVVLHGFGGDAVVSYGLSYLAELVGAGRVLRASSEAKAVARFQGDTLWAILRRYAFGPFVPDAAVRVWKRSTGRPVAKSTGLLRREVAHRFGLDRPTGRMGFRSAREAHLDAVCTGIHSHVLEASHRIDSVVGVERRYPFFDHKLVELALSLPGDQKLRMGWTRSIMRRALAEVVPEEIRQRPGKADLGPPFVRALASTDRAALEAVVTRPGALAEFVAPAALDAHWQRCRGQGSGADWFALWRAAVAARWLAHHGFADPLTE